MPRTPRAALFSAVLLGACASASNAGPAPTPSVTTPTISPMDLGAFSVSLAVKDLQTSLAFYQKLGFVPVAGGAAQRFVILRNDDCNLGLFQGMFDKNILTFNPGWSHTATPLAGFTDVRELQRRLEAAGLQMTTRADANTKGPTSLTLNDPDGNMILLDQHVP